MKIKEIGEFGLIQKIAAMLPTPHKGVTMGIGDDCAVFELPNGKLGLLTTDMLVEGVHYSKEFATPYEIGWRAMAGNFSDIAAMGGTPRLVLISLGVPEITKVSWVEDLYKGMSKLAATYDTDIAGGDTVTSSQGVLNIVVWGEVEPSQTGYRSGAKPGQALLVTGDLGGSHAGLEILRRKLQLLPEIKAYPVEKHLHPVPRIEAGRWIGAQIDHGALTDSSDGLGRDLKNLAEASKVGFRVYLDKIPIHPSTCKVAEILEKKPADFALQGGEDYELVFTLSQEGLAERLIDFEKQTGVKATVIGEVLPPEAGIQLQDAQGNCQTLSGFGFEHFSLQSKVSLSNYLLN